MQTERMIAMSEALAGDETFAEFCREDEERTGDCSVRWDGWTGRAERLFGHSLDGHDPEGRGDGYSLDEAWAYFEEGLQPADYYEAVMCRPRYLARRDPIITLHVGRTSWQGRASEAHMARAF